MVTSTGVLVALAWVRCYAAPMADEPDNLILRSLRRIETAVDALREDNREIKTRLGILEQQSASLSTRMDRLEFRLDRIERRLDLVEV